MGADKSFILQDLQRKCIRDIRKVCVKQAEDSGYIITDFNLSRCSSSQVMLSD
ncbi:MAG: hypothetical protein LUQ38_07670 [Methanotrichaceae archaeon]|nr:hypothetical protein [Methanotrichaceae archaeon]